MKSKKVYKIDKKYFIASVNLEFDSVRNFCKIVGISRARFYAILNREYKRKSVEAFNRIFKKLEEASPTLLSYDSYWIERE